MTNEDIAKRLREVADGSEIRADDEALKLIAIQSDGGMRDALSLLDQCGVMADTVTAETVRNVLGIVGREALRELVRAIGRSWPSICGRCCSIKHRPDTTKFI